MPTGSGASGAEETGQAAAGEGLAAGLDAERGQGVGDGVRDGGRGTHDPALGHAFGAEGCVGIGALKVLDLESWQLRGGGKSVIEEGAVEVLAAVVVDDLFEQGAS